MILSKYSIPVLLFVFSIGTSSAQGGQFKFRFCPKWVKNPVGITQQFATGMGRDSMRITALRFYVSGLTFPNENQMQPENLNQAYLIDVFDTNRNQVTLDLPFADGVTTFCFTFGLDSMLNTSGIGEGDLDPVEGMYWTWQSGFIHFKIEGDYSMGEGPKQRFEYHLGGYRSPYSTARQVCLHSEKPTKDWNIALELDRFLDPALVSVKPRVMSPGPDAVRLIERGASAFKRIGEP